MSNSDMKVPSIEDMEAALREMAPIWDPQSRARASELGGKGYSPIEFLMALHWTIIFREFVPGMVFPPGTKDTIEDVREFIDRTDPKPFVFGVFDQVRIGKYTADFVLATKDCGGRSHFVVIECDGHDFHERTKEQAEHDKRRDREMQTLGYPVLRFAGSEIWRSPTAVAFTCLKQVVQTVLHRVAA